MMRSKRFDWPGRQVAMDTTLPYVGVVACSDPLSGLVKQFWLGLPLGELQVGGARVGSIVVLLFR